MQLCCAVGRFQSGGDGMQRMGMLPSSNVRWGPGFWSISVTQDGSRCSTISIGVVKHASKLLCQLLMPPKTLCCQG